ncbi:MAG: nucleotidyl transferase AbiEii/AbiGii toxin family protein [Bdellovibrionaceae bacterium]|nr:nucleotidyl transferase AbiEii/AbiGii toxin family protein [Pseudobdellovibrionaceae bacterium]
MNQAVMDMLGQYKISTSADAENALKEIIQEIALLGLHRANFFEKAAFYGGTALRILYSLPRYSEDLDFTLFQPDKNYSLSPYLSAIEKELNAYGFEVNVETVDKKIKSDIESAFIKANTKIHLMKIKTMKAFEQKAQSTSKLQIKFEVDTDPSTGFAVEARYLLKPTSFPVISLKKPDLFAGKIHALLYRKWKNRVKGRDFYDYIWYLKNDIPVRLKYLQEKAEQSGHASPSDLQTVGQLKEAIYKRMDTVDFENAKEDVRPFIKDPSELEFWNKDFFKQITEKIRIE